VSFPYPFCYFLLVFAHSRDLQSTYATLSLTTARFAASNKSTTVGCAIGTVGRRILVAVIWQCQLWHSGHHW
jgi:hypothetical protein